MDTKKITAVYSISKDINNENKLFRVRKEWSLKFVPDSSLIGKNIRFFTNYIATKDTPFSRSNYREIKCDVNSPLQAFDVAFEIRDLWISGSFHFYFTTDGSADCNKKSSIVGEGYFIVDPRFGSNEQGGKYWSLDGLAIHTYLAKNLGPYEEWMSRLQMSVDCNYNMIHFTPVQELGYSRSAYSLRDQLRVNPEFSTPKRNVDWADVKALTQSLEKDHNILSMTDLVLNHTSSDSPWIHQHPQAAYNVMNSPHLAGAYILDRVVHGLTLETCRGRLEDRGIPRKPTNKDALMGSIHAYLHEQIQAANIHEYYIADTDAVVGEFLQWLTQGNDPECFGVFSCGLCTKSARCKSHDLGDIAPHRLWLRVGGPRQGKRLGATVDFKAAAWLLSGSASAEAVKLKQENMMEYAAKLKIMINELNERTMNEVKDHLNTAVNNVLANVDWRFFNPAGPKITEVTLDSPFMWNYFHHPVEETKEEGSSPMTFAQLDALLDNPKEAVKVMAFNGWVMNDDPLRNFAEDHSNVYLRRELIVWGDSVKLRYGASPEVCPALWDRMTKYAELTAEAFHAVRLDNCHSTPLHVAEHMLDRARTVRPNLYIVAELFTGSEQVDNIFINRLGINSLIRESMQVSSAEALADLVYRFGGTHPAGEFIHSASEFALQPSIAHALLYDQTHDNQSAASLSSLCNYTPLMGITTAACCAIGSTRGFDECVPHYVDVVKEERPYAKCCSPSEGLLPARAELNRLHKWLSAEGFSQTFVDKVQHNIVALTRVNPQSGMSVVMVAHFAYAKLGSLLTKDQLESGGHHSPSFHLELNGKCTQLLLEANTYIQPPDANANKWHNEQDLLDAFAKKEAFINGLSDIVHVRMQKDQAATAAKSFQLVKSEADDTKESVHFQAFPPGSVVVMQVSLAQMKNEAIESVKKSIAEQPEQKKPEKKKISKWKKFLKRFQFRLRSQSAGQFVRQVSTGAASSELSVGDGVEGSIASEGLLLHRMEMATLCRQLNLVELNWVLYRCSAEEGVCGDNWGVYHLPGFGDIVYCGIQGAFGLLQGIMRRNDLGHPLCDNLRQGNWLPSYLVARLCGSGGRKSCPMTQPGSALVAFGEGLGKLFQPLEHCPSYMRPCLFDTLIEHLHAMLMNEVLSRMPAWVRESPDMVHDFAVATLPFHGFISNARLPLPLLSHQEEDDEVSAHISLAAGLPHFAEGIWRSWGRDTFIALPGCLLLTGRFQEAEQLILQYASLFDHGLIPNLSGDGDNVKPRYNCRDAVWFWLYAIRRLRELCPTSDILQRRVFITATQETVSLSEIIRRVLQSHLDGIHFVEANAGAEIDEHMRPEGFKIDVEVDPQTGFVRGGNAFNCGTWMDKMGSSSTAGNRGIPATPRDGAAVEIVGLSHAVLEWLSSETQFTTATQQQPMKHPNDTKNADWSPKEWANRIALHFDRTFRIVDEGHYNMGAYRDTLGSSAGFTDMQCRPNYLIALAVSPELVDAGHAWRALEVCREKLCGPLGMRTLSGDDSAYRGHYDNANDSQDYATACGFNYHQGPEWLWPVGFYLRARLLIASRLSQKSTTELQQSITECQQWLAKLHEHLKASVWQSLPELTNANGQTCKDSCPAQAWSVGCVFEAIDELRSIRLN